MFTRVLTVLLTEDQKSTNMHRDFDLWEFFENVEVNAKKKKRSRCSLCGEQWWDIGVHLISHGL